MPREERLRLVVVGREHQACPLNKAVVLVGREIDNDLVLDSPTVSRHHARFFLGASGWRVRDLNSRNGVVIGGAKQEEAEVGAGDEMKIGDTRLLVEVSPEGDDHSLEQTISMATVPFVAQEDRATSGTPREIPSLIEEVIQQDPSASDLDQRIAAALRHQFGAEGVFLFSVPDEEGGPEPKVEAACRYEASSEKGGTTVLSRSTLREALRQKSAVWSPVDVLKPGQSLKRLTGAQILIYPLLSRGRVVGLIYLDWGQPCQDPVPPMTVLGSWPSWATALLEVLWMRRAASVRADAGERNQEALSQALRRQIDPGDILGDSPALRDALAQAASAAPSPYPILLMGETGVGKEIFARWIHINSARSQGPFIALNCAGIPSGTAESELFGHRKGSFTGADRDHPGVFEQAEGGTLFLDEVGDMDLTLQAKVLRAIQFGMVRRVGDDRERKVNARLIAATHRDLKAAIGEGRFREDLFYRLTTFEICLPSLRQRPSDIPRLASAFLARAYKKPGTAKGFSPGALIALKESLWPGNIRQLQSAVNHLSASAGGPTIEEADVRRLLGTGERHAPPAFEDLQEMPFKEALGRFEEQYLRQVIERAAGNATEAARLSGLPRRTFYRFLEKHPGVKE